MPRLPLLLLALLTSCGKGDALPTDLPGLLAVAKESRDQAEKARVDREPKTAAKAAQRARDAYGASGMLMKGRTETTLNEAAVLAEIQASARSAQRFARLAKEERELQDRTTGLKAKAYRTGRKVALAGTFHSLALAADQEAKGGSVPQGVRESAALGEFLAELFAGRRKFEEGTTDWPGVASDLRKFADDLPPEMSTFLAAALMLSLQDGLALVEIESVDVRSIRDPEQLVLHLLLRGLILRLNGMPESAADSFLAAGAAPTPDAARAYGQELQAGIHLFVAVSKLMEEQYAEADIEIVRAMKVWPNNPVAVFLTGERLGAMGEREAAAKSLEASMAGTDHEWISKRLAARARELRDGQGPAEPLIMDSAFLRDVALWHVWQAAKTSPPARRLQKLVDAARGFASRWTPGGASEK